MGVWDTITNCIWFNHEYQRNTIASMLAGVLFFTGWWFLIDALTMNSQAIDATHIILGILGTISLFMVNSVTQAQLSGDSYNGGFLEARGARIWIFIGFVLGFAAIIAAIWVMVASFSTDSQKSNWPGVSLLLQNVFIFVSSLVYKFGRVEEF
ncbi:Transmembrane protein [Pseudolycoriella hygida]|uniref:Transmembrane protein n=1 Tax=Pseudolycoriella hygida TaxID=35572 RepID=A0A9Q0N189_9DIPT|nr:Transmembrane protein [Pseudolycoriella hygida]